MALIEFKNVNKYYGDYHALRDINLEIEKGQVVVILGPSGSGKSTLIRTINALEPIDEGTLIVNGHNVTEASAKELVELRKEVGMVFQHFNLYPHKTVHENDTVSHTTSKAHFVGNNYHVHTTFGKFLHNSKNITDSLWVKS